jgi:hypothetical protein
MSAYRDDLERRIGALEREGPAREWVVETSEGRVLFRCHTQDEAMTLRALVVRLSREDALGLKVRSADVTPEYVEYTRLESAESRFCDWALFQLVRVSICTSPENSRPRFVVTNEGGQSGQGRTLAAALFGLVRCYAPGVMDGQRDTD